MTPYGGAVGFVHTTGIRRMGPEWLFVCGVQTHSHYTPGSAAAPDTYRYQALKLIWFNAAMESDESSHLTSSPSSIHILTAFLLTADTLLGMLHFYSLCVAQYFKLSPYCM